MSYHELLKSNLAMQASWPGKALCPFRNSQAVLHLVLESVPPLLDWFSSRFMTLENHAPMQSEKRAPCCVLVN